MLSGGVSEGAYDLVEGVLERAGWSCCSTRWRSSRARRWSSAAASDTLVFGLPGNPVSAQVTFDLFVRARAPAPPGCAGSGPAAVLAEAPVAACAIARVAAPTSPPGFASWTAATSPSPCARMGSADLVAHARRQRPLILEAERTEAAAGERVPAVLLANFLDG